MNHWYVTDAAMRHTRAVLAELEEHAALAVLDIGSKPVRSELIISLSDQSDCADRGGPPISPACLTLQCHIPVRTYSPNGPVGHWSKKSKRAKQQRSAVYLFVRQHPDVENVQLKSCCITLTRIGPCNGLDSDNLGMALKHVRDGVADALGFQDDSDPLLSWHYGQERGKDWCVRVEIMRSND